MTKRLLKSAMHATLVLIATTLYASTVATALLPDSLVDVARCGVGVPSLLCDSHRQLNSVEGRRDGARQVHARLQYVRGATRCVCDEMARTYGNSAHTNQSNCRRNASNGYTISVIVLDRPDNYVDSTPTNESIARFVELTRERLADRAQCADDALIVLFTADKTTRTSTGAMTAFHLTPGVINRVSREAQAYFSQNDYTRGLLYMIQEYAKHLLESDPGGGGPTNVDMANAFRLDNDYDPESGQLGPPQLGDSVHLLDEEILWPWWSLWPWTAFPARWASTPDLLWLRILLLVIFVLLLVILLAAFIFSTHRLVTTMLRRRNGYMVGHFHRMASKANPTSMSERENV